MWQEGILGKKKLGAGCLHSSLRAGPLRWKPCVPGDPSHGRLLRRLMRGELLRILKIGKWKLHQAWPCDGISWDTWLPSERACTETWVQAAPNFFPYFGRWTMTAATCGNCFISYQHSEIVCLHLQIMKQKNCLCSTTIGDQHIDIERVHRPFRERKTLDMHNIKKWWQLIIAAKKRTTSANRYQSTNIMEGQ